MYQAVLERKAQKQLNKIPLKYKKKIQHAIDYLAQDPFSGKKMHGEYQGRYTLRVWPYRVIYRIEKKKVLVIVLAISHRQAVYN